MKAKKLKVGMTVKYQGRGWNITSINEDGTANLKPPINFGFYGMYRKSNVPARKLRKYVYKHER